MTVGRDDGLQVWAFVQSLVRLQESMAPADYLTPVRQQHAPGRGGPRKANRAEGSAETSQACGETARDRASNRCRATITWSSRQIAYFQPIARGELFGKEVSRDVIGQLRGLHFIAAGPCIPQLGAPYTYVTTTQFLSLLRLRHAPRPPRHGAAGRGWVAPQTEGARRRVTGGRQRGPRFN
jgi:hypothetical protein